VDYVHVGDQRSVLFLVFGFGGGLGFVKLDIQHFLVHLVLGVFVHIGLVYSQGFVFLVAFVFFRVLSRF